MKIVLENVSKRYGYEWIFRDVNFVFSKSDKVAIIGPNGSGKSTLVRILLGANDPSKGKIFFSENDAEISADNVNDHFSFTGPYMDLISNFTLNEMVKFHFSFRELVAGVSRKDIADIALLSKAKYKELSKFSSGMQQRLKLTLALCSQSSCIILDEPTTNLDEDSKKWFEELLTKYLDDRILIIATNEKRDAQLCTRSLNIADFKK